MARKRVIGVAQESHRRFAAQLPVLRSNTLLQKQKCVKFQFINRIQKTALVTKGREPRYHLNSCKSRHFITYNAVTRLRLIIKSVIFLAAETPMLPWGILLICGLTAHEPHSLEKVVPYSSSSMFIEYV